MNKCTRKQTKINIIFCNHFLLQQFLHFLYKRALYIYKKVVNFLPIISIVFCFSLSFTR